VHSYPHCWRHKTPVIFRATPQWFLSMEKEGLRRDALAGIRKVRWVPAWGEQRITSMIETRPDWCISRQRAWGVPLAMFVHKETGEPHPQTPELLERVAKLVEEGGIEAWFALNPRALLGDESLVYEKCDDVMDVWLDSGVVHHCLPALRPEVIPFPVDVYLEGSDQHRGWFHSSLLASVAGRGVPPYRQVITHGFTVDEKGRKMSKSLGNVVAPQKVMSTLGADVLRLWVAATDYSGEINVSDEILKRMSDSYRRMRNTLRFLLGNLAGFDPEIDALPVEKMLEIDRWTLARAAALQAEVVKSYRDYDFHMIYQKVHGFCVIELGAFWLDILKDRLYTMPEASPARRSAQTAMYHVAEAMVRWLAPILSFTAEEIWKHLPGAREESVLLATWWSLPEVQASSAIDWDAVIALKADVSRELEQLRAAGKLGAPLEAGVDVYLDEAQHRRMAGIGDELRFVLITSSARMLPAAERPSDAVAAQLRLEGFEEASRARGTELRILNGEWIDAEISHRKKDGGVFPVEVSAGLLEFEDQKYILAFVKDITERKQVEEALQRAEQLVVVGEMAAGLAHEIKNPLSGIKLSIEILSSELDLAKEDDELFQRIVAEINRIETLLKNLLSYAKPPVPQFAPIDVNRIIEAAVKSAKYSLKGTALGANLQQPKKIEFVKQLDDLPLIVADAAQLQQVILNLLLNAVHAVHDGGTIELTTSAALDDEIRIVVTDNGKGIAEADLEKIFLPFFTTKPKGTGLGLSICKRLVEQHNGTIRVARNPDGGLTFTIRLPVEQTHGSSV